MMLNLDKLALQAQEVIYQQIEKAVSSETKSTWLMRAFSLARVPLLFLVAPKVTRIDDESCELIIPFRKIVKNHVGSMYFGAITIGAEASVGFLAFQKIAASKQNVNLIFKDFKIDFLKRAETDTRFLCEDGEKIQSMLDETVESGERVNGLCIGKAFCGDEVVAEFAVTLSLKRK